MQLCGSFRLPQLKTGLSRTIGTRHFDHCFDNSPSSPQRLSLHVGCLPNENTTWKSMKHLLQSGWWQLLHVYLLVFRRIRENVTYCSVLTMKMPKNCKVQFLLLRKLFAAKQATGSCDLGTFQKIQRIKLTENWYERNCVKLFRSWKFSVKKKSVNEPLIGPSIFLTGLHLKNLLCVWVPFKEKLLVWRIGWPMKK